MTFFLFFLLNATLFIRPAEIFESLHSLPIYEILILVCLAVAAPRILQQQLNASHLKSHPITFCVIGLLSAVALSHLSRFQLRYAYDFTLEFFKLVIYYFIFVTIINSRGRLKQFLFSLIVFIIATVTLALLQYYEFINVPSLEQFMETTTDPLTGEISTGLRLCGSGIFHDPNDLSMLLVLGLAVSLYFFNDRSLGFMRFPWIILMPLFLFCMALTKSRGGFLALLAVIIAFLQARFGWKKTIPLAVIVLPLVFMLFAGGRQTDIAGAMSGGTGQSRTQIWSEGLQLVKQAPLFGIGQKQYEEWTGVAAHSSFLHCFAELGFFGGSLFLAAFTYPIWTLARIGKLRLRSPNAELDRLRPYLFAMLVGYGVNMLSLSRSYIVPTYMMLGLATVFLDQAEYPLPRQGFCVDSFFIRRFAAASFGFIIFTYLFVRAFAGYG